MNKSLIWLRHDLRLHDNPALHAGAARGAVLVVYIDEQGNDDWPAGSASRYWLHHALADLDAALTRRGTSLLLCRGPATQVLADLIAQTGADAVYWNRRYEPGGIAVDTRVKEQLQAQGVDARSFPGNVLYEAFRVRTGSGGPYRVFTPFWKHCLGREEPPAPLPAPARLTPLASPPAGAALDALGLLPRLDWAGGIAAHWTMTEAAALARLDAFAESAAADYERDRDFPALDGVSRLSPWLHFGQLSTRSCWHRLRADGEGGAWLRQLAWRDFAHHLLYHFPHTVEAPLREAFSAFPWADDDAALAAWQAGRTGYPLVDAGMRELWHTGWMHNRVRMVVASFLVKHLRLHWLHGARWFHDTLVDADVANNTMGWQWVAGCGADAAPYFRIFNPVTQSKRFDAEGDYIRRWVPELAALPARHIHWPAAAPAPVLAAAGVRIGGNYPAPLVDHASARQSALAAYDAMRAGPA